MNKFFTSRILIGIVCFALGFLTNHLMTRINFHSQVLDDSERDERFPVNPDDFDHDKLVDVFKTMEKSLQQGMQITGVDRKEDDKFVYFEIPLNASEKNHELKVSVKGGMISIREMTPNSESERQFTIDPDLDETKADVQTLPDKIRIKIPKKAGR